MWTAQKTNFLSGRSGNLLDFNGGPDLIPFVLQQLLLKLIEFGATCADQILSVPFLFRNIASVRCPKVRAPR
jgi:hypothetical protein